MFVFVQLVELNGDARMKLSQDIEKVTIPGKKEAFRLYGGDGKGCRLTLASIFQTDFGHLMRFTQCRILIVIVLTYT